MPKNQPPRCLHVGPPIHTFGGIAVCSCGAQMAHTGGLVGEHVMPDPPRKDLLKGLPKGLVLTQPCPKVEQLLGVLLRAGMREG